MNNKKIVISSRYYPTLHGKINTRYSYRSYRVTSEAILSRSDWIVGLCDASVPTGWVRGPRGGYATKTAAMLPEMTPATTSM
jgi:hypothetical protein